jgi:hypothetical protein
MERCVEGGTTRVCSWVTAASFVSSRPRGHDPFPASHSWTCCCTPTQHTNPRPPFLSRSHSPGTTPSSHPSPCFVSAPSDTRHPTWVRSLATPAPPPPPAPLACAVAWLRPWAPRRRAVTAPRTARLFPPAPAARASRPTTAARAASTPAGPPPPPRVPPPRGRPLPPQLGDPTRQTSPTVRHRTLLPPPPPPTTHTHPPFASAAVRGVTGGPGPGTHVIENGVARLTNNALTQTVLAAGVTYITVRTLLVPCGPELILHRFSPMGLPSAMPDVQMVVMTTPFAFAGHIICLLTRSLGERIAPAVREALYVAMKVGTREEAGGGGRVRCCQAGAVLPHAASSGRGARLRTHAGARPGSSSLLSRHVP